jgi:hypothetical protein
MGIANQTPKPAFLCAKERGEPANLLYPPADQPFDICQQDRWLSAIFAVRDAFNHSRSAQSAIKPHHEREPSLAMHPHPRQVNISCHSYGFELISKTGSEYSPIEGAVRKRNPRRNRTASAVKDQNRDPPSAPQAACPIPVSRYFSYIYNSMFNRAPGGHSGQTGMLKPRLWRRSGEKVGTGGEGATLRRVFPVWGPSQCNESSILGTIGAVLYWRGVKVINPIATSRQTPGAEQVFALIAEGDC